MNKRDVNRVERTGLDYQFHVKDEGGGMSRMIPKDPTSE